MTKNSTVAEIVEQRIVWGIGCAFLASGLRLSLRYRLQLQQRVNSS